MPSHCLFNAMPAIYMPAAGDIAVSDWVQTDCTLELMLKFLSANPKAILVKVIIRDLHL